MVKKMYIVILTLLIESIIFSTITFAESDITVVIDETPVEFDVMPIIKEDRAFVPMRKIFESLGSDVEWMQEEQIVLATKDSKIMILKIGDSKILIKDVLTEETNTVEMSVTPFIEGGRTLVPLRCVSEALSCKVDWNNDTRTISITK